MSHVLGVLGQRRPRVSGVLPVTSAAVLTTYDAIVDSFGSSVISYWKFANNGTDQKGIQNATVTGSPELNIETIVDLDRVSEGTPSDGVVIAWSGLAGEYAQASHNSAHKTASGTIIITAQCDTLSEKSTLVAAGANATAGEFSIEINTDGSQRAYLRNAAGTPIVLTGTAGDVQVEQAYTHVFKWGSGGLSLALYNESGALVRRRTDPVTDGLASNTSAVRFGAWHTDVAHHDGPYGRVVWLNRRITDSEETTLARARTITHVGPPPQPTDDDLSVDPPANANVWVGPNGTASWPGTRNNPMGSIAAAIRGSSAGDVIAVAHGGGDWDYTEVGEVITGKNGSSASPIQVVGYGTRRPRIDLSVKAFRNGTVADPTGAWTQVDSSLQIWQSTSTFSTPSSPVIGWGPVGDGNPAGTNSRLMFLPYGSNTNATTAFSNTNTTNANTGYCGPGLLFVSGRVRIRMATARFSSELGHGSFPTNKNPNQQDIVVGDLPDRIIWTFTNCSWISVKNIDLLYANVCVRLNSSTNITFQNCQIEGHEDYFSLGTGSNNCKVLKCKFHFNIPNYMAWRDFKKSSGTEQFPSFNGRGMIKSAAGSVTNLLVQNCEFFGCHIAIWANGATTSGWTIWNNEFRRNRDDCIDHDTRTANMDIGWNWAHDMSAWFIGFAGSTTVSPSPQASIYVHHNLVDVSEGYYYQRDDTGTPSTEPDVGTAMTGERIWLGHLGSNPPAGVLLRAYYNTLLQRWSDPADRKGVGLTPNPGYASPSGGATCDIFNNIIVACSSTRALFEGFFAVYKHNRIDGNCWYRPNSAGNAFSEVERASGTSASFASLAALKADTSTVNASKTMWSPGIENSGLQTNPLFVGGSPSGAHDFATRTSYRPTASSVKTGAVNITSFGFPGASTYQAWRGALDPDGDGSEVGIQP